MQKWLIGGYQAPCLPKTTVWSDYIGLQSLVGWKKGTTILDYHISYYYE